MYFVVIFSGDTDTKPTRIERCFDGSELWALLQTLYDGQDKSARKRFRVYEGECILDWS